ncbi:hypothetical protein [Gaoshiqia sp. Z1-71]|uniref:hypothetical protein n=1 Tax=Gaoshiqia hydrogeniformans TaxID=3290090 RepID=UPI003BF7DBF9
MQFVETLDISKRDFYAKTGISRGTLENRTGITEDILAKFIAAYPEVSIMWLVIGQGKMKDDCSYEKNNENSFRSYIHMLEMIKDLAGENALLKKKIEDLERRNQIDNQ